MDDGGGLENRFRFCERGFESHPLRIYYLSMINYVINLNKATMKDPASNGLSLRRLVIKKGGYR